MPSGGMKASRKLPAGRGQPQRRFERVPGRRAEGLDCVVYAIAARQVVHVNFKEREAQLRAGGRDMRKSW